MVIVPHFSICRQCVNEENACFDGTQRPHQLAHRGTYKVQSICCQCYHLKFAFFSTFISCTEKRSALRYFPNAHFQKKVKRKKRTTQSRSWISTLAYFSTQIKHTAPEMSTISLSPVPQTMHEFVYTIE